MLPDINAQFIRYRNQAWKALQNGEFDKCSEMIHKMEELLP